MTQIAVGILASKDGLAYNPETRQRAWSNPGDGYRSVQDPSVPIDREHDGRAVGELVYLELDPHGSLWAIGHVDDHVTATAHVQVGGENVALDHDLYWSSRTIRDDDGQAVIDSVALCLRSARLGAWPVAAARRPARPPRGMEALRRSGQPAPAANC